MTPRAAVESVEIGRRHRRTAGDAGEHVAYLSWGWCGG